MIICPVPLFCTETRPSGLENHIPATLTAQNREKANNTLLNHPLPKRPWKGAKKQGHTLGRLYAIPFQELT